MNRKVIDHCSAVLMPYTYRSKENLVREGIRRQRIFVTGNPIYEVIGAYDEEIKNSDVTDRLKISKGDFFLVTLHRAENINNAVRLKKFLRGMALVAGKYRQHMIVSLHPHTEDRLRRFGITASSKHIRLLKPMGFFDFVKLERDARCVLSDSGTVQEECCILKVPNVTIRDVTERPETVECGSNILSGSEPKMILRSVDIALSSGRSWSTPAEYIKKDVSKIVTKIVLGYNRN